MTRFTLFAVLALAVWLTAPGEPEAAEDRREPGYLRAPVVWPEATATPTAVAVLMKLTAFSCYSEPCQTASGTRPERGTVGAPLEGPAAFSLGTVLEIEGLGGAIVADRCPGCSGLWIDYWQENREAEIEFGVQWRLVTIEKGGD